MKITIIPDRSLIDLFFEMIAIFTAIVLVFQEMTIKFRLKQQTGREGLTTPRMRCETPGVTRRLIPCHITSKNVSIFLCPLFCVSKNSPSPSGYFCSLLFFKRADTTKTNCHQTNNFLKNAIQQYLGHL